MLLTILPASMTKMMKSNCLSVILKIFKDVLLLNLYTRQDFANSALYQILLTLILDGLQSALGFNRSDARVDLFSKI